MMSDDQMDSGPTVSMDLLYEIHEAFNSRDADAIVAFFADDATFYMASGPDPHGRRQGQISNPQGACRPLSRDSRLELGFHVRLRDTKPCRDGLEGYGELD